MAVFFSQMETSSQGSEQLRWLGSNTPDIRVRSRLHPNLHTKEMIFLPDVEQQWKAQHQIRVKERELSLINSRLEVAAWFGEHLIICDAKQLKTQRTLTFRVSIVNDHESPWKQLMFTQSMVISCMTSMHGLAKIFTFCHVPTTNFALSQLLWEQKVL